MATHIYEIKTVIKIDASGAMTYPGYATRHVYSNQRYQLWDEVSAALPVGLVENHEGEMAHAVGSTVVMVYSAGGDPRASIIVVLFDKGAVRP